jgi:hypothetical protein
VRGDWRDVGGGVGGNAETAWLRHYTPGDPGGVQAAYISNGPAEVSHGCMAVHGCMLACCPCNVAPMNGQWDTRIKTCSAAEGPGCRNAALWQREWCCSDVGGSVATTVPEEEGSGRVPTVAHRGLWHPPCSGSERHHAELISTSATRRGRVVSGHSCANSRRRRRWLFATGTTDAGGIVLIGSSSSSSKSGVDVRSRMQGTC